MEGIEDTKTALKDQDLWELEFAGLRKMVKEPRWFRKMRRMQKRDKMLARLRLMRDILASDWTFTLFWTVVPVSVLFTVFLLVSASIGH